jgi:hypothetical protein
MEDADLWRGLSGRVDSSTLDAIHHDGSRIVR